jgi:3-oxoadipate enol-lactonase
MKDLQMRANGATLRCRVEGPSSAQVLLFSNSLATDLSMWDEQAAYFSRKYQVVRYDGRGHGESQSTPPPYSLSTLVEDVRSLLDGLGMGAAHFVGLSLGGMVGQLFAARYPQRLLSVVLCDTAARMRREVWEERIAAVRSNGIDPQVEPSLERWFTKPFRDKNPQVIDRFRKMIRSTSRDGYVGSATAIMEMDSLNQLSRIATPTLVVVGRHDASTPVSDAELINQKIAGSQLAVIEDAAHLPNIEQSMKFNEMLDEFLQQQSAQSQEMGLTGE